MPRIRLKRYLDMRDRIENESDLALMVKIRLFTSLPYTQGGIVDMTHMFSGVPGREMLAFIGCCEGPPCVSLHPPQIRSRERDLTR